MKNYTALALVILLTIATPAFAAQNEGKSNNGKANGHTKEEKSDKKVETQEVQALQVSIAPSGEPTISTAPSQAVTPSVIWKNHGQYVSSVAKTHPGGQAVSAAARSDIGKKQKQTTPTPSISATPSAVPSISVTPSTSPSGEPTISPSISPITSAQGNATFVNPIDTIVQFVQNIANFFHSLV